MNLRWWLGRVAVWLHLRGGERVPLGQRRKLRVALGELGIGIVRSFDIGPQESRKRDHGPRDPELGELRLPGGVRSAVPSIRTWAVVPLASAICEATVRFQMRS